MLSLLAGPEVCLRKQAAAESLELTWPGGGIQGSQQGAVFLCGEFRAFRAETVNWAESRRVDVKVMSDVEML